MLTLLRQYLTTQQALWQTKRIPSGEHLLGKRTVFILPTRQGVYGVLFLIAMLLACINYNLSLGYMLTFFVFAVSLGAMSRTHQNLVGLRIKTYPPQETLVFVGNTCSIKVELFNNTRLHKAGIALFEKYAKTSPTKQLFWLAPEEKKDIAYPIKCTKRGWQTIPSLRIHSNYPLGLWQAWSYQHNDLGFWVIPAPQTPLPTMLGINDLPQLQSIVQAHPQTSVDGDAVSHIEQSDQIQAKHMHWPSFAKLQVAQRVLEAELPAMQTCKLSLATCHLPSLEDKLGQLCAAILHCEQYGIAFVLELDGQHYPHDQRSACDREHIQRCLLALAQYETDLKTVVQ